MGLCTIREERGILIVTLPESVDHVAAISLEKEFREFVARQPKALLCDLSKTKYISSSALRIFLETTKSAKRAGIPFGLFSPTSFVSHIIDISGFTSIFSLYDTEEEALRAVLRW